MHGILVTLLLTAVGAVLISFAAIYNMDAPENKGRPLTQIIQEDLATRIIFLVLGLLALGYAAVGQFW